MNCRFAMLVVAIVTMSGAFAARAEGTDGPPGDYASTLLEVYGAMQAVRGVKEVCGDAYPQYREQNETAHARWLEDNKPVRLEVSRKLEAMITAEAGGNAKKKSAIRDGLRHEYLEMKKGLREQYQGEGEERFSAACANFPRFTQGDSVNIPLAYKTQLEILRRDAPAAVLNVEQPAKAAPGKTPKAKDKAGTRAKAKKSVDAKKSPQSSKSAKAAKTRSKAKVRHPKGAPATPRAADPG